MDSRYQGGLERITMITDIDNSWKRDSDGLGVWEHRGKVAIAGFGHSPVDRRWDEVNLETTLGAYSLLACKQAVEDAGMSLDEIAGIVSVSYTHLTLPTKA
mgnify:CR=1 FL=1